MNELSSQKTIVRKIIHVDMDCFYAQVEMRDFPEYRNIPLAVGGDGPRSVLVIILPASLVCVQPCHRLKLNNFAQS